MKNRLSRLVPFFILLMACFGTALGVTGRKVSGNLVFWDQANGFQTIQNNADVFSSVSPFWYTIDNVGQVVPYRTAGGQTYEDAAIISFLRSNNIQIIPTVANVNNGVWNGSLVSQIINDQSRSQANINALVNLAVTKGYDGIDLDYEDLPAADRAAFSAFVQNLATALHAQGKSLAVNLYAKTSEPGGWSGPQSQDYAAIGQAADEVRLMIYEYHWSTSAPGPVSPVSWVNDVLAFAVTRIPRQKIIHGLPAYGYDWVNSSGNDKVWQEAMALANTHGAVINWDAASSTPWFAYTASGVQHTVWFENAAASDAKLSLTNQHNVGGVNFWRLGREDPATWPFVRSRFGSPPPNPTPVTVQITPTSASPVVGRTVQFVARVYDQFGQEMTDVAVSWQSSNAGAMTVSSSGVGYAVATGKATVKATVGRVSSNSANVRVLRR